MLQRGQYRPEEVTLELIMTMLWILDSWCVGGQGLSLCQVAKG